jgi:hypothetical protein
MSDPSGIFMEVLGICSLHLDGSQQRLQLRCLFQGLLIELSPPDCSVTIDGCPEQGF